MFKVVFLKKSEKDLRKISKADLPRIFQKIETDLSNNPGKHKELRGQSGIYSYRIGVYRVIYTIDDKCIIITKIGHRKNIYE